MDDDGGHATWSGGRLQGEWRRVATWSAQTPNIISTKREHSRLTQHSNKKYFLFKNQCVIYKRGDTLFIDTSVLERKRGSVGV